MNTYQWDIERVNYVSFPIKPYVPRNVIVVAKDVKEARNKIKNDLAVDETLSEHILKHILETIKQEPQIIDIG